jgi:hydrogenase/urease accessory protein HupE
MRRKPVPLLLALGVLVPLVILPTLGWSHPLDPALLEIWEGQDRGVEVEWRLPLVQPTNAPLWPVLPARCRPGSTPSASQSGSHVTQRWSVTCGPRSLIGERISVDGLRERKTDALLRVHLADGRVLQAVLRGDAPFFTLPQRAGLLQVVHDYVALGIAHILTGGDHVLFVLGLVLLVHGRRRLLWTLTAFTLGHSVTLSLAVLGVVHIPPQPVEALIAASIVAVAVELTRQAQGSTLWAHRGAWAVALAFGLLHGLGFAGALAQIGLPPGEIPLALGSFNIGIELGQLCFVGVVVLVRTVLRALPRRWPQACAFVPAYGIGTLAVFWVFERVWALF